MSELERARCRSHCLCATRLKCDRALHGVKGRSEKGSRRQRAARLRALGLTMTRILCRLLKEPREGPQRVTERLIALLYRGPAVQERDGPRQSYRSIRRHIWGRYEMPAACIALSRAVLARVTVSQTAQGLVAETVTRVRASVSLRMSRRVTTLLG